MWKTLGCFFFSLEAHSQIWKWKFRAEKVWLMKKLMLWEGVTPHWCYFEMKTCISEIYSVLLLIDLWLSFSRCISISASWTLSSCFPHANLKMYFQCYIKRAIVSTRGFPGGAVVKNLPAKAGDSRDAESLIPGSGRSPWIRKWQPTPVFLPGKSHGQRSLAEWSPQSCKESDMTEQLSTRFLTFYSNCGKRGMRKLRGLQVD